MIPIFSSKEIQAFSEKKGGGEEREALRLDPSDVGMTYIFVNRSKRFRMISSGARQNNFSRLDAAYETCAAVEEGLTRNAARKPLSYSTSKIFLIFSNAAALPPFKSQ